MKGLLSALLLGSGCFASAAGAQEIEWRACREEPPPSLESCVTVGQPRPFSITQADYRSTDAPRIIRAFGDLPDLDPPRRGPVAGGACADKPSVVSSCAAPAPDSTLVPCDPFGPDPGRIYARADYLMWWFKQAHVPVLLTTGPDEPPGVGTGILGMPGTQILFAGDVGGGLRSGARLTVGMWCDDDCQTTGVEASGFFIGQRSFRFLAGSNQFPVISRPFFDLNAGMESVQEATRPGISTGSVSIGGPSSLWGAEINLRCNLCETCNSRLDFLAGPRYLQLDEGLNIHESLLGQAGAGPFAGSHIDVDDHFDTRNQFYGGQVGLDYRLNRGPFSIDLVGKVALGDSHEVVSIQGAQRVVSPTGAVSTFNGGLLALPSNSGQFTRDQFAVVPEVGVNLGYQLTDWCRLIVGYNFLYWSSVARPGDQIDRVIDVTQIPNGPTPAGPASMVRPVGGVHSTDFWAQGVSFGLEFRY